MESRGAVRTWWVHKKSLPTAKVLSIHDACITKVWLTPYLIGGHSCWQLWHPALFALRAPGESVVLTVPQKWSPVNDPAQSFDYCKVKVYRLLATEKVSRSIGLQWSAFGHAIKVSTLSTYTQQLFFLQWCFVILHWNSISSWSNQIVMMC
jgi:hypothetical protein